MTLLESAKKCAPTIRGGGCSPTKKNKQKSRRDVYSRTPTSVKSIEGLAELHRKYRQNIGIDHENPEVEEGDTMAARTRPRSGFAKEDREDAHEEKAMWEQIVRDLEKCKAVNDLAKEVSRLIIEKEEKMSKPPSLKETDELAALYREALKLAEEEQRMLKEEPMDIMRNLGILMALRTATVSEPQRSLGPSKVRKPKAPKPELDGAADSPGPSPSISNPASRLKGSSARSGSVASTRDGKDVKEPLVKVEEGPEGINGPSAERAGKFSKGAEVAYKQNKLKEDGSQWIQCIIINIVDVGNKKRYEVQDPEPDETGAPGQIYKASASALIAIPPPDAILPDYPVGKHVLARYPETTTFYRAEVTWMKKDVCRLKFEDDQNQEMEVDRRFVLELGNKQ